MGGGDKYNFTLVAFKPSGKVSTLWIFSITRTVNFIAKMSLPIRSRGKSVRRLMSTRRRLCCDITGIVELNDEASMKYLKKGIEASDQHEFVDNETTVEKRMHR